MSSRSRALGRSGVGVSRLTLAGSFGISAEDTVRAFHELGVSTFFATMRTRGMNEGLRRLVADGHRDALTIIGGAQLPFGFSVPWAQRRLARELTLERIDVFLLFWVQAHWYVTGRTWSAMRRLKEDGLARAVGISCHDRPMARALIDELSLDVVMLRYNAAHRGIEREVFRDPRPDRSAWDHRVHRDALGQAAQAVRRPAGDVRRGVLPVRAWPPHGRHGALGGAQLRGARTERERSARRPPRCPPPRRDQALRRRHSRWGREQGRVLRVGVSPSSARGSPGSRARNAGPARGRNEGVPAAAAPTSLFAQRGLATRATTSGVPLEVWRLAWPAIAHTLLLTAVFAVDRLVLGRTDTTALASLQISSVLVWTITSIFTAFSAGTLALAGRAFGAGDRTLAADVVGASLALALGVGALVAVSTLVATRLTLPWLFPHAGDAVLVDVARYLELVLPVLPLAFVEAIAASALHAAGDTRTPLVAAAASNAINLLLSCVLVFGLLGAPALGVRGAAIGAAAAMTVQAIALVRALLSPSSAIPLGPWLRRARVDRDVLGRLVRVSLPAFGDKLVYAGGYLAFIMLVATLGPVAMAANQAVVSVEAICFLSAEGFGVAAGALAAQRLGAGQPSAAEQTTRVAITMAVCALTAFGLLFAAAPRALLSPFTSDQAVLGAATASLVMAALAQPFMAYATVTRMALRGAGATSSVLWVTVAGTLFVRMPVALVACLDARWGLAGVWLASTLDWVFQAIAFGVLLRRGRWKSASP
jgi:putative MATE family efflux protein